MRVRCSSPFQFGRMTENRACSVVAMVIAMMRIPDLTLFALQHDQSWVNRLTGTGQGESRYREDDIVMFDKLKKRTHRCWRRF